MVVATINSQNSEGCQGVACGDGKHVYVVGDEEIMSFQGNGLNEKDEMFWISSTAGNLVGDDCSSNNKEGGLASILTINEIEKTNNVNHYVAGLANEKTVLFEQDSNKELLMLCYKFKGEEKYSTFPVVCHFCP